MTYETFVKEYESLLNRFLSYTPEQAGSLVYASKLADLADAHPDYMEWYDIEESAKTVPAGTHINL